MKKLKKTKIIHKVASSKISTDPINIVIPANVWEKIYSLTRFAKGEISGFGTIKLNGENLILEKISLFKQVCTSGHTTLDSEALSKFLYTILRKGYEDKDYILCWWHSHNDFSVFFSGTDEETITSRTSAGSNGKLVSIVTNKNGDIIGRYDNNGVTTDMNINILPRLIPCKSKRWRKEVARKVTNETYKDFKDSEEVEFETVYDGRNPKRKSNFSCPIGRYSGYLNEFPANRKNFYDIDDPIESKDPFYVNDTPKIIKPDTTLSERLWEGVYNGFSSSKWSD